MRALALLQLVEGAIALGLAWIALHAPGAAPALLGASGVTLVWAVIADGPLAVARLVGFRLHRRVLVVIGLAIAVLPLASGQLANLEVTIPCLGAAAALLRFGLVRWPPSVANARAGDGPPPRSTRPPGGDPPGGDPTGGDPTGGDPTGGDPTGGGSTRPPGGGDTAAPQRPPPTSDVSLGRRAGRMTERAGTMAAQKADVTVSRWARAAGKAAGRAGRPRPPE